MVVQDAGSAVEFVVAREKLDVRIASPSFSGDSVLTTLWMQTLSPNLMILLLSDLTALLRPSPISLLTFPTPSLASHACSTTLHALSDLHNLFSPPTLPPSTSTSLIKRPQSAPQRAPKALILGAQKLVFYAAIVAVPGTNETLGAIAHTLDVERQKREVEGAEAEGGIRGQKERLQAKEAKVGSRGEDRARIEEIG